MTRMIVNTRGPFKNLNHGLASRNFQHLPLSNFTTLQGKFHNFTILWKLCGFHDYQRTIYGAREGLDKLSNLENHSPNRPIINPWFHIIITNCSGNVYIMHIHRHDGKSQGWGLFFFFSKRITPRCPVQIEADEQDVRKIVEPVVCGIGFEFTSALT